MFKKSTKKKLFAPEESWKILVVDDEPEVHTITKVALSDFTFDGKKLQFLNAYSGEEANRLIAEHPDIALIFLDVVMESDHAGLHVVEYVRKTLNNKFVRIILRTGQPGQAPERKVIINYDINDYKEKTALDSNKLFTATYAALRSYNDIMSIESSRKTLDRYRIGLEEVINSSARLFEIRSLKQFASGLLYQLASLLHVDRETMLVRCNSCMVVKNGEEFEILAATGNISADREERITDEILGWLNKSMELRDSIIDGDIYVGFFPTLSEKINLLYIDGISMIDELDQKLLKIFTTNVTIAFDNLYLDKELYDTQVEIIDTLGDVVETRSKETANHVKRVAHLSRLLGQAVGLANDQVETLYMAAPMHDIGKVAIPDSVLLKPGKLDPDEWEVMKTHATVGEEIFANSKRPVLKAASVVAGQHHEKFDGSGYPRGLQGEDIHIFGRIVAVVDVFDALVHKRCYKEPWPIDQVLDFFEKEQGKHFDPKLVKLLVQNLPKVKQILTDFPES